MLTIHGAPISVHTRKALLTARLKGLEFDNRPVIPFDPPEDWHALSPTGLIPALSHGDYTLADSNAICAYLERLNPEPAIYPSDARAFGTALWLEQYATTVLFKQIVHPLFFQKVVRPGILQEGPPEQSEIDRVETQEMPAIFQYLEDRLDGPHLAGDTLSIADISIGSNLINCHYLGSRIDAQRFPKLAAAFDVFIKLPAVQDGLAAEAPFVGQMGLDQAFAV